MVGMARLAAAVVVAWAGLGLSSQVFQLDSELISIDLGAAVEHSGSNSTANSTEPDPPSLEDLDTEKMRRQTNALAQKVRMVCAEAKAAPGRVDSLTVARDDSFVKQQDTNIRHIARMKGLDKEERELLGNKYKNEYKLAREALEKAKDDLTVLETNCREAKHRLDKMQAAEEKARQTGVTNTSKPKAAFDLTAAEIEKVPLCDNVLSTKRFQKWLSWEYAHELKMQEKEVGCWGRKIDQAEHHQSVMKDLGAETTKSSQLSMTAIKCVVDPLAETMFRFDAQKPHPAAAGAVAAFIRAVEAKNTSARRADELDLDVMLGSSLQGANSSAPKASGEQEPPSQRYPCLLEEYKKAQEPICQGATECIHMHRHGQS